MLLIRIPLTEFSESAHGNDIKWFGKILKLNKHDFNDPRPRPLNDWALIHCYLMARQ